MPNIINIFVDDLNRDPTFPLFSVRIEWPQLDDGHLSKCPSLPHQ